MQAGQSSGALLLSLSCNTTVTQLQVLLSPITGAGSDQRKGKSSISDAERAAAPCAGSYTPPQLDDQVPQHRAAGQTLCWLLPAVQHLLALSSLELRPGCLTANSCQFLPTLLQRLTADRPPPVTFNDPPSQLTHIALGHLSALTRLEFLPINMEAVWALG